MQIMIKDGIILIQTYDYPMPVHNLTLHMNTFFVSEKSKCILPCVHGLGLLWMQKLACKINILFTL